MDAVTTVVLAFAVGVIGVIYFYISQHAAKDAESIAPPHAADVEPTKKKQNRLEQMRAKKRQNVAVAKPNEVPPTEAVDNEEELDHEISTTRKLGAKKAAKLLAKEEKKAQREAIEAEREDARKREELRREEELAAEIEASEVERQKEEEAQRLREEEKKKEQEEYEAMKAMFSVDEVGSGETDIALESQGQLTDFIDYIKENKVVLLEQLATKFGLKTQDAKRRLEDLDSMGRITGVMDDRGKYIYISEEEMGDVVKFVKR